MRDAMLKFNRNKSTVILSLTWIFFLTFIKFVKPNHLASWIESTFSSTGDLNSDFNNYLIIARSSYRFILLMLTLLTSILIFKKIRVKRLMNKIKS